MYSITLQLSTVDEFFWLLSYPWLWIRLWRTSMFSCCSSNFCSWLIFWRFRCSQFLYHVRAERSDELARVLDYIVVHVGNVCMKYLCGVAFTSLLLLYEYVFLSWGSGNEVKLDPSTSLLEWPDKFVRLYHYCCYWLDLNTNKMGMHFSDSVVHLSTLWWTRYWQ